jgi:multidrug efflux system membrane fusion protein
MRLKPLIIVVLGMGIVTAAVIYWPTSQTTTQQQGKGGMGGKGKRFAGPPSTEPVPVRATVARRADVPVYLDGVGTARALNTVLVKPQVEGKLIAISFTEGQEVTRGHVLAKIDPTTYQAQYDQAVATKAQREAQLANAKLDLERYMRLAASNAINKQQVDTQRALVAQLEAQTRADQAAIDNTRAILSYTEITAPIAGRTGIRQVDEGNIVRGSDPNGIVVITQLRPISILFTLPQQQLSDVTRAMAKGPPAVEAFGPDNRTVIDRGTLLVVDNQVDQTTGTIKLKAEFPNKDLQLWPGQFVNVRVKVDTLRNAIVVPTSAVQRGPAGTYAFVIGANDIANAKPISVVQQTDVEAVIGGGLSTSDRVVTTGFANLAEGSRVIIGRDEGAPTPDLAPRRRQGGQKGAGGPGGGQKGPGGGKGGGQAQPAPPAAGGAPSK